MLEYEFFVLSGNIIFLFHENMILPPRQKMKDDLSQKSTWKYDILLKILKRWSFQKDDTGIWSFLYYLERWYFFAREHEIFSLDGKWKIIFFKKYMETWKNLQYLVSFSPQALYLELSLSANQGNYLPIRRWVIILKT